MRRMFPAVRSLSERIRSAICVYQLKRTCAPFKRTRAASVRTQYRNLRMAEILRGSGRKPARGLVLPMRRLPAERGAQAAGV
jgi:hypothetical protein